MPVCAEQTLVMLHDNKPAIADKSTPGIDHLAIGGRVDRLIVMSADINALLATPLDWKWRNSLPRVGHTHLPS